MHKTVSILGCGWLGLPLAEFLLAEGFAVKGSTTSAGKLPLLAQKGIQPFLINLQSGLVPERPDEWRDFLQTDILLISIPPRTDVYGHDAHARQIRHFTYPLIFSDVKIIYISSTSVYPEKRQTADETSEVVEGNAMVKAEKIVLEEMAFEGRPPRATVLRCGGLMGYNRIPGKYVAGKTIATGDVPVNFVHRDDVVRIIHEIIRQEKWGGVYNVVAPQHPVRRDIYARNAQEFGYAPPLYDDSQTPGYKLVSSEKVIRELDCEFLFPDPVSFPYAP